MDWKKIGKTILFPHIAIVLALFPVATAMLVLSMIYLEEDSVLRIVAYVISFYALVVLCARLPKFVAWCKGRAQKSKLISHWTSDVRLRMRVTLIGAIVWNCAYAVLQLVLGVQHKSAWFYSLSAYYFALATMRIFLACHTVRYERGENMQKEYVWYRACGWIFLLINVALTGMMIYIVRGDYAVSHNQIVTISMATYTFFSFAMAITNVVRYKKFQSPVFSASKIISLASSCVSVVTLESTMLATFNNGAMSIQTQKLLMALTGGAIATFIVVMAIYMIVNANKKLNSLKDEAVVLKD